MYTMLLNIIFSIIGFIKFGSIGCQILIWISTVISIIIAQSVPAIPADSFVESIGINTHWAFPNIYSHNYPGLKTKLAESGIRYVRDRTHQSVYDRANDLYQSLGIKTNMLTARYKPGSWPAPIDPSQIEEELNEVKTQALAATVSLEAPNEYDLSHGPDTDWAGSITNYTIALYTTAKADAMLKNLPVIGPSLTSLPAYETIGNLDQYIDYPNLHMYQWSYWPGSDGWYNNGTGSITWYLNDLAHRQSPSGKRVQATETGHHNYLPNGGVSEEADGKYTARTLAEFFRRGIYRTYKYELIDEGQAGQEGVFGLLRNDLSEKPAFRAVKNLITILTDKGPNFKTDTFNYVLNGSIDNVHQLFFQKRNGDFYLMIWLEISSWNVTTKIDLYPLPQQVFLTLQDTKKISSATLYAFNNTADVNAFDLKIDNNQVTFNVTDKISIIKLSNKTSSLSHGLYRLTPKINFHLCFDSNQQWIIEPVDDGFYRLVNSITGYILHIDNCNINDRNVMQTDCEKWKFELLPNDYYRITPKYAQHQCLDAKFCSLIDNTQVQPSSWSNNDYQHWKLDFITSVI